MSSHTNNSDIIMPHFCTLKFILIGESGVGKTSLLQRFTTNVFNPNTVLTIIDSKTTTIDIDGKKVKLEIWDTAGQERYRAITREYYRGSDGIILMYDVTKPETFYKVSSWLAEIRDQSDGLVLIVGNKTDEPVKSVQISTLKRFAEQEQLDFMEISVKLGINVDEVFVALTRKILSNKNMIQVKEIPKNIPTDISVGEVIILTNDGTGKVSNKKNKKCC